MELLNDSWMISWSKRECSCWELQRMYWTGSQTCLSLDILRQADAHLLSKFIYAHLQMNLQITGI